ncbi:MAG TPA: MFS transporter [Paucimonas sp.]|nr:MFS transporter [Paucimonas sp.]
MNSHAHFSSPRQERFFLLALAGMQFTHILDFMIMMPLGPQLIRALHIDTRQFGLLLSSYSFAAAASGLLSTIYIDRFDRRRLALTLYLLFIVATLSCGLAPNYPSLLAARALCGAFGGVLGAVVQTMIADTIPFERRGKAMGMVMASFSMSTVAGVPLGLFLANHIGALGWRAPFFFVVLLSLVFFAIGYRLLPSLVAHMHQSRQGNILRRTFAVAREPAHLVAFAYMAIMMMSSFTVIPYIALYMTSNVGMSDGFITLMYLCGGAATFFTAQWFGRLADRYGKPPTFRWIAAAAFVPILFTTHMPPVPAWLALINSTAFFVLVSGRMIPGMAMVTAVAQPQVRGAFMSLVSSVQMLAAGFASLVAGLIITRGAGGQVEHYNLVGYIAVACGMVTIWLAQYLRVAAPPAGPNATAEPIT